MFFLSDRYKSRLANHAARQAGAVASERRKSERPRACGQIVENLWKPVDKTGAGLGLPPRVGWEGGRPGSLLDERSVTFGFRFHSTAEP